MRNALIIIIAVCILPICVDSRSLVRRPSAPAACAYDFCEGLEGPGYENSWTEIDTGNRIDDQSTGQVHTGTYSLYLDGDAVNTFETLHNLGGDQNSGYFKFEFYTISGQAHNAKQRFHVLDAAAANVFICDIFQQTAGGVVTVQTNGGSAQTVTTLTEDAWHCVELYYIDGTLSWKVDGAAQTDSTGGTDRNIRTFEFTTVGAANFDAYYDEINFEIDTWIGCT